MYPQNTQRISRLPPLQQKVPQIDPRVSLRVIAKRIMLHSTSKIIYPTRPHMRFDKGCCHEADNHRSDNRGPCVEYLWTCESDLEVLYGSLWHLNSVSERYDRPTTKKIYKSVVQYHTASPSQVITQKRRPKTTRRTNQLSPVHHEILRSRQYYHRAPSREPSGCTSMHHRRGLIQLALHWQSMWARVLPFRSLSCS